MTLPKRVRSVSDLDSHALRCHLYRRHSFPLPVFIECTWNGWPMLRADLRCECGVRRVIYLDGRSWAEDKSMGYYVWPDDYLVQGGLPDQVELRQEAQRRAQPAQRRAAARAQREAPERARRTRATVPELPELHAVG